MAGLRRAKPRRLSDPREAGALEQLLAGGGEREAAGGALQQGHAELGLERRHAPRHRAGLHAEALGRPREGAVLDHAEEGLELFEGDCFHG